MTRIDPRTLRTGCTLIKNLMAEKQEKHIWLVVWNMGIFIPTDELIFFREGGIPPTRRVANFAHLMSGFFFGGAPGLR